MRSKQQPNCDRGRVLWLRAGSTAAVLIVIFLFYIWTVKSCSIKLVSTQTFNYEKAPQPLYDMIWTSDLYGFYNILADSFLAGKLSLLVDPPKEMLALSNPYDPQKNGRYKMWDASLYKGKYYLYFGPTPALTLFIPFRVLGIGHISESLAAALFAFGALLWSVLLLRHVMRKYLPGTPFWMFLAAVVCLGVCNAIPFLLRRAVMYEVAVTSGNFYLMGGLYFAFTGLSAARKGWRFLLASLFLGLAVGARPTVILAGAILILVGLSTLRHSYGWRWRPAAKQMACLAVPYLLCVFLLGLYNYLRFDSWAEFGHTYQLGDVFNWEIPRFHPGNIPVGIYYFWLQPYNFNEIFPFFHLVPWGQYHLPEWFPWTPPRGWMYAEPVAGLLPTTPVVAMVFLSFVIFFRARAERARLNLILAGLIGLGLGLSLLTCFTIPAATMRYQCDYLPVLLLGAVFVWFFLDGRVLKPGLRGIFRGAVLSSIVYSVLFNVGISFTGHFDLLKARRPSTYYALEERLWPVTRFLSKFTGEAAPGIIDLYVPQGIVEGREEEGSFLLWVGTRPVILKVHSPSASQILVEADWLPGPDLGENSQATLIVRSNGSVGEPLQIEGRFSGSLKIPVDAGPNWITLKAAEKPGSRGPGGGEKLVGLHNPRMKLGDQDKVSHSWTELRPKAL